MNGIDEPTLFGGMSNTTTRQNRLSKVGTEKKQILNNRAFAKKGFYLLLIVILLLAACSKPTAVSKSAGIR